MTQFDSGKRRLFVLDDAADRGTLTEMVRDVALACIACALILVIVILVTTRPAAAHDDAQWILEQRLHNQTGEWCCGKSDCNPQDAGSYAVTAGGYRLTASGETIPFEEASPLSVDGRLWICRRPDGTRRCVFDRPPGS